MASLKRDKKNTRFTQKHPDLPKNKSGKFASRTAWADKRRAAKKS